MNREWPHRASPDGIALRRDSAGFVQWSSTKRPIVALLKQARAFGVGDVLATQTPMDLDYRVLGNAGLGCGNV